MLSPTIKMSSDSARSATAGRMVEVRTRAESNRRHRAISRSQQG
jgi:hypothetical protein